MPPRLRVGGRCPTRQLAIGRVPRVRPRCRSFSMPDTKSCLQHKAGGMCKKTLWIPKLQRVFPFSEHLGQRAPAPVHCRTARHYRSLVGCIREQRNVPGAFDRHGHLALVLRAIAGYAARHYLGSLRDVPAKPGSIFVVDVLDLVHAKRADSPSGPASSFTPQFSIPPLGEAIARGAPSKRLVQIGLVPERRVAIVGWFQIRSRKRRFLYRRYTHAGIRRPI